ncbi:MAG: GldG family protein [Fibrobacterota bacterium]
MDKKLIANRTNFLLFIVIVLGFVCVVNYLASRVFVRADLTANKMFTISKASKKVIKNLDDLVTLKVYISEKDLPPLAMNLTRSIKDLLSEYEAYGRGKVTVEYFDPTDNPDVKSAAQSLGLQEVPMQIIEKDKQQNVMCFMGLAILYGDKKEMIPVLNNVGNLEYDLTSRILKVTRTEVKQVGFYFGNGPHMFTGEDMMPQNRQQQPPASYNNIKKGLQEQFEVRAVNGLERGEKVPSEIATLVVAGPKSLSEREKFELDQFVMRGGRLVALIDAMEIVTSYGVNAMKQAHNSSDLFESYGAKVEQDIVADARSHANITYQVNYGGFVMPVSAPYPYWVTVVRGGFAADNPAVSCLQQLTFMWPSAVTTTLAKNHPSVQALSLLKTTPFAMEFTDNFDLSPNKKWNFERDKLKGYDLGVVLTGEFNSFYSGKPVPMFKMPGDTSQMLRPAPDDATRSPLAKSSKTTVVLIGDSDFLSDGGPRESALFMVNLIEWLTLGDNLISIRSKEVDERLIDPKLSMGAKSAISILNMGVMPLLVVAIGIFVYVRRRNRTRKGGEA